MPAIEKAHPEKRMAGMTNKRYSTVANRTNEFYEIRQRYFNDWNLNEFSWIRRRIF